MHRCESTCGTLVGELMSLCISRLRFRDKRRRKVNDVSINSSRCFAGTHYSRTRVESGVFCIMSAHVASAKLSASPVIHSRNSRVLLPCNFIGPCPFALWILQVLYLPSPSRPRFVRCQMASCGLRAPRKRARRKTRESSTRF